MILELESPKICSNADIVIAEDSITQAKYLEHILSTHHFKVRVAHNGKEALDAICNNKPTLLISDILMPEMDGYQLCSYIRSDKDLRNIPVILLTSLTDPIDVIKGLECGADNFITKPFNEEYLLSRIQYVLVNQELRKHEKIKMGVEIVFGGKKYLVTSERQQILDLLLSIYEAAVQKNKELVKTEEDLRLLNGRLEELVAERTATLVNEMKQREIAEEEIRATNKRLEEAMIELKMAQKNMVQQERLRALGQMASGIAHDFNNSLSPVMGFAELLLESDLKVVPVEKIKEHLKTIYMAAGDAAEVVRRMREFYRQRDDKELELPVALNDVIEQVIKLTEPRWQVEMSAKGCQIKVEVDLNEIPDIIGNEAELREMFLNLVFNAVDAMPIGGKIAFHTGIDNGNIVVSISDTGIGMTEDVRQHCLEPFFSTKGEKGTGLGLSIVYGIAKRHKGIIDIKSHPGDGTTFFLSFPQTNIGVKQETKGTTLFPKHFLHVLVVEDLAPVGKLIGAFLKYDGHTFELAENGRQGLEIFQSGKFDIIITDKIMPEINGDQLALFIKQISPDTPVIMLTGLGEIMQATGDIPAGVDLVLNKPLTLNDLRQALNELTK